MLEQEASSVIIWSLCIWQGVES